MPLFGKNKLMYGLLFIIMGASYFGIELLWRGYSHYTMFILGGICGTLVGLLNEHKLTYDMPLWKQILYGEMIVLPLEFLTGVVVNLWLGLNVWDYSDLPFKILGQFSPLFALIFAPVILLCIVVDDFVRWKIFKENKPKYILFKQEV